MISPLENNKFEKVNAKLEDLIEVQEYNDRGKTIENALQYIDELEKYILELEDIKDNKYDWKSKNKLDRKDLISMAKGISPNMSIMDDYPINHLGSYYNNQGWQWNWDAFNDLTDIDIYNIYIMCKNS